MTEELQAKQQEAARKEAVARGQEGAAGRGCGCEGRRGTSVQKKFGPLEQSSSGRPAIGGQRAGPGDLANSMGHRYATTPTCSSG